MNGSPERQRLWLKRLSSRTCANSKTVALSRQSKISNGHNISNISKHCVQRAKHSFQRSWVCLFGEKQKKKPSNDMRMCYIEDRLLRHNVTPEVLFSIFSCSLRQHRFVHLFTTLISFFVCCFVVVSLL